MPQLIRQGRRSTAIEAAVIRALAEKIAADLMSNVNGDIADRLVLELPGKRDGGGLCAGAVVDRIESILRGEA